MNNEPVYGNHIGVVVSNEDPEGRNRVQVFVPYVSTTLFDDWNAKQVDIEIGPGTFDKIDAKILARLKLNLPWAEAALPMFGGNGSVSYNKNHEATVLRAPVTSMSPPAKLPVDVDSSGAPRVSTANIVYGGVLNSTSSSSTPITDISQINESVLKGLYGLGMAETGFNSEEAYSRASNSYRNLIRTNDRPDPYEVKEITKEITALQGLKIIERKNKFVAEEYSTNGGDLDAAIAKFGDTGYYQVNPKNNKDAKESLNTGTAEEQTVKINNFIKDRFEGAYNLMKGGQYKEAYEQLKGFWNSLDPVKNPPRKNQPSQLDVALASTKTDANTIINKIKNVESGSSSSSGPAAAPARILATDPSATHVNSSFNNITTPGGVHSKPQIGTMVWVFFYGGDTMRPVYFAGVSEPQSIGRSAG